MFADNEELRSAYLAHISKAMALLLWRIEAVKIDTEEPFKLKSGNYSPIYIDCRRAISSRRAMRLFEAAAEAIMDGKQVDVVAGGETAGIPYAAYLSKTMNVRMVYVRKENKEHGTKSKVEGWIPETDPQDVDQLYSQHVWLIEDLITDGGSKIGFVEALRSHPSRCLLDNCLVLFDRQQGGKELLEQSEIDLHSVTNMDALMATFDMDNLIPPEQIESVCLYLEDSEKWHKDKRLEWKTS